MDSICAFSEVLVLDRQDGWAQIKSDEGPNFWTPIVDEQGHDLLAQVLPEQDPCGRLGERVWQYQRVHDAIEICMKLISFGPKTTTLFIPNLPLDLLQQLELAGCDTHSAFVKVHRDNLRSFRILDILQQRMVTACKQLRAEGGPRFPKLIAPGHFPGKYGITGKRLEQLVWAMGTGPSTAKTADVVELLSKHIFASFLCRHSGSANIGTNLLDSDVDLVVHMPTRDPHAVTFVRERFLSVQNQGEKSLLTGFSVISKPFCVTLQGYGQEIDVVPVFLSAEDHLEQFDPISRKWQRYRGKEHTKQFMMAMERLDRLPDLVRLAKAWNKRLKVHREGNKPLLPGLLIQLCLTQMKLPKPVSECTLPEQLLFAFSHLRDEWKNPPPEEQETHARLLAKLDGLKEHVDQALDVACQQLTRVVHLEKLEWQQLSLSQQRSEAAAAAEGLKRPRNIFRALFDENLSFEAKEYADEATAILNDLFGNLDHYLQYDPSLEQEKLKQLGGRLCGEPGPLLTTQWIINGIASPHRTNAT